MSPEELSAVIGVLVLILIALVGWIWVKLTDRVEKIDPADQAVLAEKVKALEGRFDTMHDWKGGALQMQLDRMYENVINHADHRDSELSRRIDLLERKVLNGSK